MLLFLLGVVSYVLGWKAHALRISQQILPKAALMALKVKCWINSLKAAHAAQ